MPFNIHCPSCKSRLKTPEVLIGKQVKCPGCGHSILVPAPEEPRPVISPVPGALQATKPPSIPPMEIRNKPKPPPLQLDELEEVEDDEDFVEADVLEEVEEIEEVEEVEEIEGVMTEDDFEFVEEDVEEDEDAPPRKKKPSRGGTTRKDERSTAMLIHLLSIFTGFIGPLILWLMKRKESRFVDHHGKEALNLIITMTIGSLIIFITGMILVFSLATSK